MVFWPFLTLSAYYKTAYILPPNRINGKCPNWNNKYGSPPKYFYQWWKSAEFLLNKMLYIKVGKFLYIIPFILSFSACSQPNSIAHNCVIVRGKAKIYSAIEILASMAPPQVGQLVACAAQSKRRPWLRCRQGSKRALGLRGLWHCWQSGSC